MDVNINFRISGTSITSKTRVIILWEGKQLTQDNYLSYFIQMKTYIIYFGKREFICLQVIYLPKPPIKLPRPPPAPCCNCRITFCNPGIPPKSIIY